MIVPIPKTLSISRDTTGDGALKQLRAYWERQRGSAAAPPADGLYLSDLAAVISHVFMCFRDEAGFRVEFAGAEAQDLLGFDPTGELLMPDDPVALLAGVALGAGLSARNRRPELTLGGGWTAIELPFVEAGDRVTVVLIGVVSTCQRQSAEVLAFRRGSSGL
jgi:hypothetical protein